MAGEMRLPSDPVEVARALAGPALRGRFFPLVAFLERLTPDAARVGETGPLAEEAIRFRHDPALVFSAADVSGLVVREVPVHPGDPDSPVRPLFEVTTTFLGLTGAATPLPGYLAEELAREEPGHAPGRELLDLLHHRLLSLFYRIRGRYELGSEHSVDGLDRWSRRVLALVGVDAYERPPAPLPAWRLLRLAPLLAWGPRTARGLERALEDVLGAELEGARVTVIPFDGGTSEVDEPQRFRLGAAGHRLGRTSLLGRRVADRAGRFRIRIGPLPRGAYERLQPGGALAALVEQTVEVFARDPLEHTLELVLATDTAPRLRLSCTAPSRLGRDSWLGAPRHEARRSIRSGAAPAPGVHPPEGGGLHAGRS